MQVIETIQSAIERGKLIPDGMTLVAGISGGADSVALARAFHHLNLPFTIAHLNHQLRGDESDLDERFVCDLAEELDRPVVVKRTDVRALAAASEESIEMAARQARHDFFSEFNDAVIALAHQADDQVETFILRMGRGAGTEGLSGMPSRQRLGELQLIRPMLNLRRADLLEWLKSAGYTWREDTSNLDESFQRNRIRHTVLPFLEKELNPNLRETVLRTMDILQEENRWMDSMVARASGIDGPGRLQPPAAQPAVSAPAENPRALRRRMIRKWLFAQAVEDVGFDAVEKLLSLMDAGKGTAVFELNDRQRVWVEYGVPRLETARPEPHDPRWTLTVERGTGWKKDHGRGVGALPAEASFDAGRVGNEPIEVRTWRPGDRMTPRGTGGSRKLQDIFTDEKIPRARRHGIPVVVCRGEIIWLPGYRTAQGWEVDGEDGSAIHAHLEAGES